MASRFNLTGVVRLLPPKNLGAVRKQIANGLKGVNVPVQVQVRNRQVRQVQQLGDSLKKVSANAKTASTAMENLGLRTAQAIRRFGSFTLATTAIFSLIRALSNGINEAVDFQTELIKIRQVTGLSVKSLSPLTKEIARLSTGFGVSSSKLLEASRILSQAGFSANDTRVALEALAKSDLAPTFEDIIKTTEGSIAAFRQFGLEANQLEDLLGSINAVSGRFAVESGDLISAIRRTGGAFQAAGGSVEELIALFTSVRATTRESADSIATGFRTIFTRLQRNRTQSFLQQFGIQLRDLEGNFVGPFEAIRKLSIALQDIETTDTRFAQITEELGGFRQVSRVIPLIKEFGTAQTALQVAFQGTTSLSEDAIKSQDALARQIAKVREEFALLLREISDSDSFKAYVRLALDLARALIEVTRALKPILPALATLGALGVARNAKAFAGGLSAGLAQPVRGFNTGGFIPGQGNRDTVPAMLTPGEFVVRKEAVQQVGLENLQRINRSGKFGKFNKGGIVGFQRGGAVPVGAGAGSGVDFTSIFLLTSVVGTLAQSFEGLGDTAKEFGKSLTSGIAQFFILRQLLTSIGPASQIRGELAQSQLSLRELRTERSKLQPQLIDSQQRLRDARSNVDIAGAQAAQAEKNELGKRVAANKAATIATNQEIRARQRSANVIAAGTAAVTSLIVATNLASQFLRRNASAELQNIRSGIGGNRNRFVSQSAAAGGFSGFSAGATAGLGIGAAAGTIVPGLGNVAGAGLGVVIGGTIGALNQYQSALKQARIELEKIDLSNEFNEFSRIIQKFNQGELSLNSSIGRINKQITDFGNQLETVSNAELREDLQGRISQARPALQTFVDTLARSSSSLEDFNNRLGEDRLNTLTTVLGISFSELQKSIRETIDASNNRLRIDRQSIQAQEQLRNRLVLQLEFASSVRDAATAAATFDSQLQSLSSSLSGSPY
jgi:TP901 family phage tail tape measure protein